MGRAPGRLALADTVGSFVDALILAPRGQAIAANLWRGVFHAEDVLRADAGQLLLECAKQFVTRRDLPPKATSEWAVTTLINTLKRYGPEALLRVAVDEHALTKRLALLLRRGSLLPGQHVESGEYPPWVIIAPDRLQQLLLSSPTLSDSLPVEPQLAERARQLADQDRRPDAKLGDGVSYLVWLTPADNDEWRDLVEASVDQGCADQLFDHLGLPRDSGEIALLFEFDATALRQMANGGRFAAPTIFEGYSHPYWRQVMDRTSHGGMGLTLHLDHVRQKKPQAGGAREVVVAELEPWHESLGGQPEHFFPVVNRSSDPTPDHCGEHLWVGIDALTLRNRFIELALDAIPNGGP